ncbi:MAG: tripartite tricarboxylate transporter permease, partial [Pseudomonadota bacterium]
AMLDIWWMLLFGVIGYVFKKLDYPLAPMVLALVLGDRAEENFRNAIKGSEGDLMVFFSNGLVGSIMALGLVMLFWPLISGMIARLRGAHGSGTA